MPPPESNRSSEAALEDRSARLFAQSVNLQSDIRRNLFVLGQKKQKAAASKAAARASQQNEAGPQSNMKDDDPHNLHERFIQNQKISFISALAEIREGQKKGCWLWFIFPTAPYIVNGVERGSSMNQRFALRGDDCVKAYLQFQDKALGVHLRMNYLTTVRAVHAQLERGRALSNLFGPMDEVKVISSLNLFERIATDIQDEELASVCREVLELSKKSSSRSKIKKRSKGVFLWGIC